MTTLNYSKNILNTRTEKIHTIVEEKRRKYVNLYSQYLESSDQSLISDLIYYGRDLSDNYLNIYLNFSDPFSLLRVLDFHQIFGHLYPNGIYNDNNCSKYFIKDKCKHLGNQILVLFFLNQMTTVKKELLDYKSHYDRFKKYLKVEFYDIYKKMQKLYYISTSISVIDDKKQPLDIDNRLGCQPFEDENLNLEGFRLQRVVIIGSCAVQVVYRGFTIDMLRMSQAIERKPTSALSHSRRNGSILKWQFHNSSIFDVEMAINDASVKMKKDAILFLYISADSFELRRKKQTTIVNPLVNKGLKMKQLADGTIDHPNEECMLPLDIISCLVGPSLVIIDSESSHEFHQIKDHVTVPLLCLLSPSTFPRFIHQHSHGRMFTMFLSSPLKAFCWICSRFTVDYRVWQQLENCLNQFMYLLLDVLKTHIDRNCNLRSFMADTATRVLLLRYFFCSVALRLHDDFPVDGYLPKCNLVKIELEVVNNKKLHDFIYGMAQILDSLEKFALTKDLSLTNDSIDVCF